jgi:hypothetical protein
MTRVSDGCGRALASCRRAHDAGFEVSKLESGVSRSAGEKLVLTPADKQQATLK